MAYRVIVTSDEKKDLDERISYLMNQKQNPAAALAVLDDYDETVIALENIAGSLKNCENKHLQSLGYKRINFRRNRYFPFFHTVNRQNVIDVICTI